MLRQSLTVAGHTHPQLRRQVDLILLLLVMTWTLMCLTLRLATDALLLALRFPPEAAVVLIVYLLLFA